MLAREKRGIELSSNTAVGTSPINFQASCVWEVIFCFKLIILPLPGRISDSDYSPAMIGLCVHALL
jgi:hypothetical protein